MAATRKEWGELLVSADEIRCGCRRLLAQVADGQIILRCPRCKTRAVLRVEAAETASEIAVEFFPDNEDSGQRPARPEPAHARNKEVLR